MNTLVKTFAAAALIAVSTFAMAAEGPGAKATKANVNLSTADLALKSLKKQKGEKLNCTVSTDIIEESADYMVAKVTLKFENFIKTDLVTLERVGNDWKVSRSINSYK